MNERGNNKTIRGSKLLLVARRWTSRGARTDFDHFFRYFNGARIVSTEQAFQRPYFLLKRVAGHAGQESYTSYSAGVELAVMLRALLYRPKIIHYWFGDHEFHYAWKVARLVGARIVGNFFFSIEEFKRRIPDKRHLRKLDLLTSSGKKQMEYLKQFVGHNRIAYLPLGVETGFFAPPENWRNRWNKPQVLLHVGKNRRDIPTLRKVFVLLKKRFPDLRLELVLGDFAREELAGLDSVKFHSFLSDEELAEVYQKATLLVLPLLEGGSSQTLNEAMSTGLPVVTNNLPNLEDYVSNQAVYMSPSRDAEHMAECCARLLSSRDGWEKAAQAARQHMLQYDFREIRDKILRLYKDHFNISIHPDDLAGY